MAFDPLSESGELPGGGTYEPGKPPQFDAEFLASSEEEARAPQLARTVEALDPEAMFNPDGSPRTEEAELLDELQRVQRDVAIKRLERKRRLEQQLALARQQLQAEEEALW